MFLGNLRYKEKVFFLLALIFIIISTGLLIIYILSSSGVIREHREHLRASSFLTEDLIKRKNDELARFINILQSNKTFIEYFYISTVLSRNMEPVSDIVKPIYISQKVDVLILYDMNGNPVLSFDTLGEKGQVRLNLKINGDGFIKTNGALMIMSRGPLEYTGGTVGYVVVGKYIDEEFFADIKDIVGNELFLVIEEEIAVSTVQIKDVPYKPIKGNLNLKQGTYSVLEKDIKGPDGNTIGKIVIGLSDEMLLNSLHKLRASMLVVLLILAGISFGFALLFIKALVSPLKEMVSLVDRVGKGEFKTMVEIKGKDEVARLSERFNDMQRQLGAQRDALERYTENLEYTVEERTKELRGTQEQLLQVQKMDSLGALAGGIAHDFNNLLSAILGYASFIKEEIDESHPHYKYWNIIEQVALRGSELTSHLLTFSRGRVELKAKEPVDINRLIKELLGLLGRTFDMSISVKTGLSDERLYVFGDSNTIYQALLNICVNAGDAMPEGGTLTIETSRFYATEGFLVGHLQAKSGAYIQINVTDTGMGIEKKHLERIFEPFFTTKELGRGTGLGLAIVYGIVKDHGGFIDVYSEPGKGTTFKLYLPAYEEEVTLKKEDETSRLEADVSGTTILVVDDEEPLRRLCRELLESAKYTVLTAQDGLEAVTVFQENKDLVSLVILDMIMPNLSGYETLRRLKAIKPSLKVILTSGFSKELDVRWSEEKAVKGFIEKPYRLQSLLKKVKEVLASTV
ncbi:MAG: response regulator [Nitrospirae bacterium]|nr:response regulator [Nitrospirota bacterium]